MTDENVRLDGLNYLATIQYDLEQCRRGGSELHSDICRRQEKDESYDATQDHAALRVIRTRIDGLQGRLDRYVAESCELGVGPVAEQLARQAYDLDAVIGDYLSELYERTEMARVRKTEYRDRV